MGFEFPELPYAPDALEPHIDAMTMTIHHGKHHRAYYDKMVAALEGTEALALPIERVLARVSNYGAAVRNNAGGYFNHCAFWNMMSPDGGGDPVGSLAGEVDRAFGSADKLREEISAAGIARFGSGFAWLIVKDRQLKVVSTPNQDNPLMDVIDESARGIPILGVDVWEHAYYLKYQNRRPDYIKAFWQIVNWKTVGEHFEAAMNQ